MSTVYYTGTTATGNITTGVSYSAQVVEYDDGYKITTRVNPSVAVPVQYSVIYNGQTIDSGSTGSNYVVTRFAVPSDGVVPNTVTFKWGTFEKTVTLDVLNYDATAPTLTVNTFRFNHNTSAEEFYLSLNITYGSTTKKTPFRSLALTGVEIYDETAGKTIATYPLALGYVGTNTLNTTITDTDYSFTPGHTISLKATVTDEYGFSKSVTRSFVVPAWVTSINTDSFSIQGIGTKAALPYTLVCNRGEGTFDYSNCTFTVYNSSVISINSSGVVTAVGEGQATYTVTNAHDGITSSPKTITVLGDNVYPFSSTEQETASYLNVSLVNRINKAMIMVADANNITLQAISDADYNSEATKIRKIHPTLTVLNRNARTICSHLNIEYDAQAIPNTVATTNKNRELYFMVNEWLRLMMVFAAYV